MGIRKIQTTPYHPQTNGATERRNRYISTALAMFCNVSQTDWHEHLDLMIAFAYRTSDIDGLNVSPFELLYESRLLKNGTGHLVSFFQNSMTRDALPVPARNIP